MHPLKKDIIQHIFSSLRRHAYSFPDNTSLRHSTFVNVLGMALYKKRVEVTCSPSPNCLTRFQVIVRDWCVETFVIILHV